MKLNLLLKFALLLFLLTNATINASFQQKRELLQSHPNLILTKKSVLEIKSQLGNVPVFDKTLEKIKKEVSIEIEKGIKVPVPKDLAGGYTHTQHKINYATMQKAGVLFQLLADEKYAIYIRDMLLQYAKLYPTLKRHLLSKSYAKGMFFWQCLNDANWLVYTSQAYDCIYDWLSKEETVYLNKALFKPYADFLSIETPQFFNRIHNHSTWGNVAVGMIGLVMNDEELVKRALYGLDQRSENLKAKDNDGGFIYDKDGKAGFLANLEAPFSPDGYYTEGPYYQRYAMYPFLIFAEALQNKKPELKIFEYKNGVLIKAVNALLNLTDKNGVFFPLNDAQKGMSYYTSSLVSAIDIAYYFGGKNPELLSIAKKQNKVQLDITGLSIAKALEAQKEKTFVKKSLELSDGAKGNEGGIGILRYEKNEKTLALVFKYTAQGLSHGHYDKLSFSLYENGNEVIQDYGFSRFVNVEQKNGGGYLKENSTFAKQTIAHNTVVQDEASHFKNNYEIGSKHHSDKYLFDDSNPNFQIVSAKEQNAYSNTELHRTMMMVKEKELIKPFIIDVVKVTSTQNHTYDLPYYYLGQIIHSSFRTNVYKSQSTLGKRYGYQHLWKEATGNSHDSSTQFTWLNNKKFYTITSVTNKDDEIILARIGANDPQFNLRKDPTIIFRKENENNALFMSIIESHGTYNPVTEKAKNAYSKLLKIEVLVDNSDYSSFKIHFKNGKEKILILSNKNNRENKKHSIRINDKKYSWKGAYYYKLLK
ncbi:heparinase II/III domain-containing protein [Tenacibaculum sp. M341]|uniref:heparinase II/III domain-containing protein n=1 Tax=Tenacibaculum sp. M341 TaxID=2530339 RepID=UPI00104C818A|nr:heparinase II/III family protein [Tenacibaculum sp. M341]TCI85691.1 alginate lyase family protein [Tenacibaculum sp. M341]